jgi:hypothetical protein
VVAPELVRAQIAKIVRWQKEKRPSTKKRCSFLEQLCEAEITGKFNEAAPNSKIEKKLIDACYKAATDAEEEWSAAAVPKLLEGVIATLKEYYAGAGSKDAVVIRFQKGTYRPEIKDRSEIPEAGPSTPSSGDLPRVHEGFPLSEIERLLADCKRFRVSGVWIPHLATLAPKLKIALSQGAKADFLLSHPDSPFAKIRAASVTGDSDQGRREIIQNRNVLRDVLSPGTTLVKLRLTSDCFPTSYMEIDDRVYFSALWFRRKAVDGWWASTDRNHSIGKYFADQFEELFAAGEDDDLKGDPFPPPANNDIVLRALTQSNWVGQMQEVGREGEGARKRDDVEEVEFTVKQPDSLGQLNGSLRIAAKQGPVNLVLRNGSLRERHIAFICEDQDPAVARAGILLLGLDTHNQKLTGYYTGWSERQGTRYTCRLDLQRAAKETGT